MRKQYHFRKSAQGTLAWDIDRLVELSGGFGVRKVPLSEIRELDKEYWFGFEAKPTCRTIAEHIKLVEEADLSFPIILDAEGQILDGMHRVVKALLEGRSDIDAVQFPESPEPDYIGRDPNELPY